MDIKKIIENPLIETDNYVMGVVMESDEKDIVGAYAIINRNTEVVESAHSMWPTAISTLVQLEKSIPEANVLIKELNIAPKIYQH